MTRENREMRNEMGRLEWFKEGEAMSLISFEITFLKLLE
jgi:hypothetical protein